MQIIPVLPNAKQKFPPHIAGYLEFFRVFQKFCLFIPLILGAYRTMFCGTPTGKHRCRIYAPQIIILCSCIIFTSQSTPAISSGRLSDYLDINSQM